MIFINFDDLKTKLSAAIRNQITDNDDTILDDAERQAIAIVRDAFDADYDMDAEFAKTGIDRHENLKRWILNLMLYAVYERIPDREVPARIVKNYDDTLEDILLIERGKRNTTLTKQQNDNDTPKTVFRWGSNKKRSAY